VHSGHEAFFDAVLLVHDESEGCEAVGGARCVGEDLDVLAECFVVDALDEHWRVILGGCGEDDLLGAAVDVAHGGFGGQEDACALADDVGAEAAPLDGGRGLLVEDFDGLAADCDRVFGLADVLDHAVH
jgi:hypothetical protein